MEVWNRKDPTQEAREFVKKHQLTYPVVVDVDGSTAKRYAPEAVPTNIVIGKDGTIRYLRAGFEEEDLRQAIDAALKE
jgi:peroxiredoxin